MHNELIPIPVTILSGFLGSGKTTYLNHLLLENKDKRYAIIENEFGEQSIDNELIIQPDETIVELNNGCLCCTLNNNLYDILNVLNERRDEFDEIIIEATGVANPAGLAQPFIAHPLVKKHFPLKAIVCLVDAELIEDQLADTKEAMSQVTFSDILLINKTDLVSESYIKDLLLRLKELNPLATIVTGHRNKFPNIDFTQHRAKLDEILKEATHDHSHGHDHHHEDEKFPVQKPHHHHHHEHTQDVNSLTFVYDRPFDLDKLRLQLTVYLTFQSSGLYRIKGLIWLVNDDQQYILQSVGSRFDLTPKQQWVENNKKQSVLVFIGRQLERKGLERVLTNCLSNAELENSSHSA